MKKNNFLCVSIVNHGHGYLLFQCLKSLDESMKSCGIKVSIILTFNLPDIDLEGLIKSENWSFDIIIIKNIKPLGFGQNHNQAFLYSNADWFAVVNPDIYWLSGDEGFCNFLKSNNFTDKVGMVYPVQIDKDGNPQDFARNLITPINLLLRVIVRKLNIKKATNSKRCESIDWVSGACMFFRSNTFRNLNGFDKKYFMYCEDVDICLRMRLNGYIFSEVNFKVLHLAQRNSHKKYSHLKWHLSSLVKLWFSLTFWRYLVYARVLSNDN